MWFCLFFSYFQEDFQNCRLPQCVILFHLCCCLFPYYCYPYKWLFWLAIFQESICYHFKYRQIPQVDDNKKLFDYILKVLFNHLYFRGCRCYSGHCQGNRTSQVCDVIFGELLNLRGPELSHGSTTHTRWWS